MQKPIVTHEKGSQAIVITHYFRLEEKMEWGPMTLAYFTVHETIRGEKEPEITFGQWYSKPHYGEGRMYIPFGLKIGDDHGLANAVFKAWIDSLK